MNNQDPTENPMHHPDEQPTGTEGTPKFGRLLLVLFLAVVLIAIITFVSEAIYS